MTWHPPVPVPGLCRSKRTSSLWPLYPFGDQPGGVEGLHARVMRSGAVAGCDRPVVFLHGLVGLNDHWDDLVSRVEGTVDCTCFEVPLLSLPERDCSIEGVTRLTERFLREQFNGTDGVVLVGNSFGGHVALRLAIQCPELVQGLVLAGSSGLIEKSIVGDVMVKPSRAWLKRKIEELYYDPSSVREQDVDRAFAALSQRGGARAMVRLSKSARRDVLRSQVSAIRCPTLVLWGKQDVVTPPEAGQAFGDLIPGAKLVWIDNCGHVPMAEGVDVFARELTEFVEHL